MGIALFVLASGLIFSRVSAEKNLVFFFLRFWWCFLRFLVVISYFFCHFAFWGVFSRYTAIISRAARNVFWLFSPAGP